MWRIHNLYKCMDKAGKTVPFIPWDEQREFLQNIWSRNLILKSRQRGFTTLMGIVQLDDCLFNPNVRSAILAHRADAAKLIFQDKVKFPYDNLDEALRAAIPPKQDAADTLVLANNSRFIVTTSVRSGTLKWLHVSEYGKICAENPDRAREIRTGSFPAAEGGVITIESTAEGEEGDFFDISTSSENMLNAGLDLTRKDFKFFFYPWWRAKEYVLPRTNVPIGPDDEKYFEAIGNDIRAIPWLAPYFKGFSQAQKNWWVTEADHLGSDMKREFPATPKESFEQSLDGAIFADELAGAYKHNRIGAYPLDTRYPVNTFWDLGRSHGNATAIWLEQDIQSQPRFVGYYEKEGESIDQHLRNLKEWGAEHGVTWGKHYMPHDGDRQELWLPEGTLAIMGRLGFNPSIVTRAPNKWESIQVGRRRFPQCQFDAEGCKVGISRLKRYRKEWDERRGVWRDHPYHGPESNGADAFLTFSESGHTPAPPVNTNLNDAHRHRFYNTDSKESWLTE